MALLQRLKKFLAPAPADPATTALYRTCVTQARQAAFYHALGIPDTLDGRFDLLLLHVFLVIRRLNGQAREKQALFDLMFSDMDRSLREMGVGDMGVGKRMRPMIAAFYGRAQVYEKGLEGGNETLTDALRRNLFGKTVPEAAAVNRLAMYVRNAADNLAGQPLADIMSGHIIFPAI